MPTNVGQTFTPCSFWTAEDVGGVERPATAEVEPRTENFVARKAVGNFVEMAGLATFHISPLTVLATLLQFASLLMMAGLAGNLLSDNGGLKVIGWHYQFMTSTGLALITRGR